SAELIAPRKRPLGFELALVVLVSLAVLVPGIWSYSLVDPWETHYGEVARMMLQNHDWVHTEWPQDGEGFRSKPVLTFWLMVGGVVIAQAVHYAIYFSLSPQLAVRGVVPPPALSLPLVMVASVVALHRDGWLIVRMPSLLIGGIIAAIADAPIPPRLPGQTQ